MSFSHVYFLSSRNEEQLGGVVDAGQRNVKLRETSTVPSQHFSIAYAVSDQTTTFCDLLMSETTTSS